MSLNFIQKGTPVATLYSANDEALRVVSIDPDGTELPQIKLTDSSNHFFPRIPNFAKEDQVSRVYVCGESGCGKSSWMGSYVHHFREKYPKAPVLLFSSKTEDKVLDSIPRLTRVPITSDLLSQPITLDEIIASTTPVLTIFDDCEDFPTKGLNKEVDRLLHEILRNGRSRGIFCLYSHHNPTDYRLTRNMIFESTHVCTFPRRSGKGTYNYLYEKKLLLPKEIIQQINTLPSQFVCIAKQNPKCVISNDYIICA